LKVNAAAVLLIALLPARREQFQYKLFKAAGAGSDSAVLIVCKSSFAGLRKGLNSGFNNHKNRLKHSLHLSLVFGSVRDLAEP